MELLGNRIRLTPASPPATAAALEVAMLGHCPGSARLERLFRPGDTVFAELRRVGYRFAVDRLLAGAADDPVRELYHLPVPLSSTSEFDDLFPAARRSPTGYSSKLAGADAWLPQAVEDFFANGGQKLWLIRIPEDEGEEGFLPAVAPTLHEPESLTGLGVALSLSDVGVVALPDLERLRIPANLQDIRPVRLARPAPRFLPCSEPPPPRRLTGRRQSAAAGRMPLRGLLDRLGSLLARYRPDLACLLTLPLGHSARLGRPLADPEAIAELTSLRASAGAGRDDAVVPFSLRRLQFLFPYLRGQRGKLRSPVGLVAGLQARVAAEQGPWRSMAGMPMLTDSKPFPAVSVSETARLRETPGIGIIRYRSPIIALDDERLVMPALPPADYAGGSGGLRRVDGFRSGEIGRFLGYLLRALAKLGDALVFNVDVADARPGIALEEFFRSLHAAGALRGALPEDAYRIERRLPQPGAVVFHIRIAPAFPIDRLRLTFSNRAGNWRAEISRG